MYNPFQKEQYLSEISNYNSQRSTQRIFNASESLENYYQKDICDFNKEELIDFFAQKTGTNDIAPDKSLLKTYINWCISNGKTIFNINYIDRIHSYDIDKRTIFREKYLLNGNELDDMLNIVYGGIDSSEKTVAASKELIIRLCYLGLENEEIVQLKKEMVDYENHIIFSAIYPGLKYSANDKVLELCKYCSEQTEYILSKSNGQVCHEPLCDNDYVIRRRIGTVKNNIYNEPLRFGHVVHKIKEFCNEYEKKSGKKKTLTADKLRDSGLFHLIHSVNDKESFLYNDLTTKLLLKDPDLSPRNLRDKINRIKKSYEIWVRAFEYPEFQFQQNRHTLKKPDIFEEISQIYEKERDKATVTQEHYTRNQQIISRLKKEYGFRCQLCQKNNYFDIETLDGYYVEVHHIIPNSEGVDEEGSLDRPGNMIVVCPNHHKYLHWNKGGNYKLQKENDCLYLANASDKLAIITDLHLSKYNNL